MILIDYKNRITFYELKISFSSYGIYILVTSVYTLKFSHKIDMTGKMC